MLWTRDTLIPKRPSVPVIIQRCLLTMFDHIQRFLQPTMECGYAVTEYLQHCAILCCNQVHVR